jgi:hypothetical protein
VIRRLTCIGALAATLIAAAAGPAAAPPLLHFSVFADTGLRLADVAWTGSGFLYVENTTNKVWAAGPAGLPLRPFVSMPQEVEETRCRVSRGGHGFTAGDVYCHSPSNKIYRISPDGGTATVFATLPEAAISDGALAFDTGGRFGYALLAATGRSGSEATNGGTVYAVDARGDVRTVGGYPGPGGADEIAIASIRFGTAAHDVLLTVDAGTSGGSLAAMDGRGRSRTLVTLHDGPNPIVTIGRHTGRRPAAPPGLYVTDTATHDVFFAPAADFERFLGDVVVGSEITGAFWIVRPRGRGFDAVRLATTLQGTQFNLEGATYIPPR